MVNYTLNIVANLHITIYNVRYNRQRSPDYLFCNNLRHRHLNLLRYSMWNIDVPPPPKQWCSLIEGEYR